MAGDLIQWELNKPLWDVFFEHVAKTGNIKEARELIGFSYAQVHRQRKTNPEFMERLEAAAQDFADVIGAEARRRAIEGVDEPVWYQGEEVGTVRKYSDTLLLAMLKAHDPRYKDKSTVALTDGDGKPLNLGNDELDVARRVAFVMARGLRAGAVDAEFVEVKDEEGGGGRESAAPPHLPSHTQNFPSEDPDPESMV